MVLGLGVAALLASCEPDAPAPTAPVPAPAVTKKAEAAPAPTETTAAVEYSYNPINKRDPFRGLNVVEGASAASDEAPEDRQVCMEPLCQYDLDELTVVAVVSGDANPLAMVEDRAGTGFLVRRNTKIGKQGGKVTQVLRDCLVVTSFISGPDNKAQAVKTNMCVKTDTRSTPPLDLLTGKVTQ
jgi:type IV pilus assembly protein PilP